MHVLSSVASPCSSHVWGVVNMTEEACVGLCFVCRSIADFLRAACIVHLSSCTLTPYRVVVTHLSLQECVPFLPSQHRRSASRS